MCIVCTYIFYIQSTSSDLTYTIIKIFYEKGKDYRRKLTEMKRENTVSNAFYH